jgi:ABC-type multidrug transport system fused ATPase/permease subunit
VPTLASAYGVKLVADGVLRRSLTAVCVAAVLIAVARKLTWLLGGLHVSLSMKRQEKASLRIREDTIATWKAEGLHMLSSLLFSVGYIEAIALVLRRALAGYATAGDVLLAISLATQMQGTIVEAVAWGGYMGEVLRAAMRFIWLEDYAIQARSMVAEPLPVPDHLTAGIALDHVSFRYPETDRLILDDVSLFRPGVGSIIDWPGATIPLLTACSPDAILVSTASGLGNLVRGTKLRRQEVQPCLGLR